MTRKQLKINRTITRTKSASLNLAQKPLNSEKAHNSNLINLSNFNANYP